MNRIQSSSLPLTAIDDWVRGLAVTLPSRTPRQLSQLQFHWGKPPPAAEPRMRIRTASQRSFDARDGPCHWNGSRAHPRRRGWRAAQCDRLAGCRSGQAGATRWDPDRHSQSTIIDVQIDFEAQTQIFERGGGPLHGRFPRGWWPATENRFGFLVFVTPMRPISIGLEAVLMPEFQIIVAFGLLRDFSAPVSPCGGTP